MSAEVPPSVSPDGEPAAPAEVEPVLPDAVRQRAIALVAAALPGVPDDELPAPIRKVARFAPHRRAKLGAAPIAQQLAGDPLFRQRLGDRVAGDLGSLGLLIVAGEPPPAQADPLDVAALAYLTRPPGWREVLAAAHATAREEAASAASVAASRETEQRLARAEHDRAVARVEAEKLREELSRVREEASAFREEARSLTKALKESQVGLRKAQDMVATEKGRAARAASDHEAEVRRLMAKLAEAQGAAEASRQSGRLARAVDDARLWLLLETIGRASAGLRRELALDPAHRLPADFVADEIGSPGTAGQPARALDADDPAHLDNLIALPKAHLIVDGYNVTKRGFGEISLEQQRQRLITAMGGLAAQSGTEVTVVFDGAERMVGIPSPPRGVRVLFSRKGETADEVIRRLVRAEPPGRPIVVVSSDKEVADGVRRHGAYPLSSDTLLRRIARS
jgi:predicted RNA-binding protein with PIN domain